MTNPPSAYNNTESKIQWDAANTQALDNPFWSADGITYDKKSMVDFVAHPNFLNNVVIKWDANCFISDFLTWDQSYGFTPVGYNAVNGWDGTPCYADPLEPVTDNGLIVTDNGGVVFDV